MSRHNYSQSSQWKGSNRRRHKRRRRPQSSRGFDRESLIKNIILLVIAGGLLGALTLLGFMAFISKDLPNPNSLTERTISQTTKIYDRTGDHLLYEIFGDENRTLRQVQEGFCGDGSELDLDPEGIPLYALQATIAAEDRNFCNHSGFDVKGFARAVFQNLLGNKVGGSTLTQQLVKNAILSNEKTIIRKAKELVLSLELERRYTKDEILQIYFNEIPYGSTYYGIEAAAQNYYGKSAGELSLAEAVTIASLPKAPTTYLNNPDRLQARRDYILGEMLELEFISQEDYDAAVQEQTPIEASFTNIDAPHFVLHVKEQLEETYGRRAVEEGGMRVITTLDFDKQMIAEEEVAKGVEALSETYNFSNAALVAIDPKTGQVLVMVGSKDYFDDEIDGQVNVATRLRQPGSSFKPIVYTKSIEMGYTPNTVVWDVITSFPTFTGDYTPKNYDLKERGPIRLRDALQGSLNIPAVKMVYMVGVENALDFATSLGYSSFGDHSAFGLSLVLGGGEVKLLEHTNAYAVFANEGERYEVATILRVEDSEGVVLEQWKERDGKKVIDKNTARTISHVLSDNNARTPYFGAGNYLQLGDRPVAAKTGTTNDSRDAWLMGYTPSLAVGVWAGNNDNETMSTKAGGSNVAGPIWNAFMRRALAQTPIEYFTSPTIEATGKPVLDGEITSTTVIVDRASGKLATEFTPESYREERMYAQYHSLLHFVDRSNPTGQIPENPQDDEMYEPWEAGIATWIANKQEETGVVILNQSPPTEEDDVHVQENFPTVRISSPNRNDELSERKVTIQLSASARRGVARTEFYVDGQFLGSDSSAPWSLTTSLPSSIGRGVHTLKAIAYDDIDNSGSDTVTISVSQDGDSTAFELIDPSNGQTIERTSDTYTVVVQLENPENYRSVSLYAQTLDGSSEQLVGQQINPSSPFLTFEWTMPASGTWALSARAVPDDSGTTLSTAVSLVEIIAGREVVVVEEPVLDENGEPIEEPTIFTPESDLSLF
ncbi:MAG: transglycosylase domain-containing protein [Parcubacteria group bacterium]|nr:transglycosylase domain-containing protein [Parcubacteria group bacterium]